MCSYATHALQIYNCTSARYAYDVAFVQHKSTSMEYDNVFYNFSVPIVYEYCSSALHDTIIVLNTISALMEYSLAYKLVNSTSW